MTLAAGVCAGQRLRQRHIDDRHQRQTSVIAKRQDCHAGARPYLTINLAHLVIAKRLEACLDLTDRKRESRCHISGASYAEQPRFRIALNSDGIGLVAAQNLNHGTCLFHEEADMALPGF